MTPKQAELVQTSFANVVPIADAAAEIFYNRLFEIDPSLRSMFRGDMKQQGKKLMDSLKMVGVIGLDGSVPVSTQRLARSRPSSVSPRRWAERYCGYRRTA